MIRVEVAKLLKDDAIRASNSERPANCSTVRKKDDTARVEQDFVASIFSRHGTGE